MAGQNEDIDRIREELSLNEKRLLLALRDERSLRPDKAVRKGGFSKEVEVMNAASWLRSKGLVKISEEFLRRISLGRRTYAVSGLPERRVLEYLAKHDGAASLEELEEKGKFSRQEIGIAIGWLNRKRWARVRKEGGQTFLVMTETGKKMSGKKGEDEKIIDILSRKEMDAGDIPADVLKDLKGRKDVITEREEVLRRLELTDLGRKVAESGLELKREVTNLTSEMMRSGKWKDVEFRRYDVNTFATTPDSGRVHPLTHIIERIRRIFLDMGFSEITGNYAELELWNMDALFIPQDHPAREEQDTFYIRTVSPLDPLGLVEDKDMDPYELFASVHENGGETGSTGWGYRWSKEKADRAILRTHTTVNTIRYCFNNPKPPIKVFSIEKVFRNESIDSTHLPEFHQIEGILVEEGASMDMLVGLLREFYARMGFEDIRVRPGYFPYTEPSLEVDVHFNGKWMELGGAGIFRPEVTQPAGIDDPVLAWGLGLERLAMMVLGRKDIRDLYISDMDWLRSAPFV
ncbi:phenylalanine--tRNA ligase subunit alpha [Thermoplasmatales archaeon ex4484_6]|nr:MAG: phenylalanine--tRNA ligase subunit alpha [Thermoplasmatales archaeon ex4484_6]RLF69374.1 MAG: phenylalanine--tRNA ligase subunit alpha [Thermoplasmata archaeon]